MQLRRFLLSFGCRLADVSLPCHVFIEMYPEILGMIDRVKDMTMQSVFASYSVFRVSADVDHLTFLRMEFHLSLVLPLLQGI